MTSRESEFDRANPLLESGPLERPEVFSRIFEDSPDMMCVVDRQHRYRTVNPAFAQRYARSASDLRGKHVIDLRGQAFYEQVVLPHLDRAFGGEGVRYEEWFDYPNGGHRYMEVNYYPLFNGETVDLVVVVVRDLTQREIASLERERLVAEAQERAAELDAVVESTDTQLALLDRGFTFLRVNSAYITGCGYRREDLLGRNHFTLFPHAENEAIFAGVRDTGIPYRVTERPFTFANQPGRGTTYWNWSLVPVKRKDGEVSGVLLSLTDVTQQVLARHRIEQLATEAQDQAARLSALLDSLHSAVIVLEAGDGAVVLRNKASRHLTSLNAEGLSQLDGGGRLRAYTANGEALPVADWPGNRLLRGEEVEESELILERPDGSRRVIVCSGSAVRDSAGRVAAAIVVSRDITDVRRLEQTREEFIYTISHDLRQPLTVIQGQAQLLIGQLEGLGLEARSRRSLQAIHASAKRMGVMITDLVETARIESGQLALQPEPVDLYGFVGDMLERASTEDDRERLHLGPPEHPLTAMVDRFRLERVLINIVTNALRYSPPDRPVRVIVAEREGQACVSVADEGPGIPEDEQSRLFERYRRLRAGQKAEGLGLGLYISRLIVEAHGGRIWCDSQPGRGATFSFTLPLA